MALNFTYQLKRSGLLGDLKIAIRPTGEVIVTAPNWLSEKQVATQVAKKAEWIEANLAKITAKSKNTPTQVEILGKKYQKSWGWRPELKPGVNILSTKVYINGSQLTAVSAEEKLTAFLKLTAQKYILQRVPQLAQRMNLVGRYRRIVLKKQSSRWGSCSSQGNLNFNWTLIHYSPPLIDYVIIHELAHLEQMNHSAAFWQIVAQYDPEYKQHRRQLNNH